MWLPSACLTRLKPWFISRAQPSAAEPAVEVVFLPCCRYSVISEGLGLGGRAGKAAPVLS